jgi:uncharacterized protein YbaR (Trm112 family)
MKVIKTLEEWLNGDERMARRLVEEWKNDLDKFLFDGDNYEFDTRSYQADYDSEPEVEVIHAELINPVCAEAFISEGGIDVLLIVDAYQGDDNIYLYVNGEDALFVEQRELQDYMYRRMDEALEEQYRG